MAQILGAPIGSQTLTLTQPMTDTLVHCQSVVDQCHTAIREQLQSELMQRESAILDCEACIGGQIVEQLNKRGDVIAKSAQRIVDSINQALGQTYLDLAHWFPERPTPEQMAVDAAFVKGLETGFPATTAGIMGEGGIVNPDANPRTVVRLPGAPLVPAVPSLSAPPGSAFPAPEGQGGPSCCPAPTIIVNPPPCPPAPSLTPQDIGQIIGAICPQAVPPLGISVPPAPPAPPMPPGIGQPPGPLPPPPIPQPPPQPAPLGQPEVVSPQQPAQLFTASAPVNVPPMMDFCRLDVCQQIVEPGGGLNQFDSCNSLFGFGDEYENRVVPKQVAPWLNGLQSIPYVGTALADLLYGLMFMPVAGACWLVQKGSEFSRCVNVASLIARFWGLLLGLFSRWLGDALDDAKQVVTYNKQFYCPVFIPSQGELNSIAAHGLYPDSKPDAPWTPTHDCLTRALGNCPDWQKLVWATEIFMPSANEAWRLQQLLPDMTAGEQQTVWHWGRVWYDYQRETLDTLNQWQPSAENLFRLWQTGAYDTDISKRWGLATDFDNFWNDLKKRLIDVRGLEKEDALAVYHGNWTIPQLRMIARLSWQLRSDSIDPEMRASALTQKDIDEIYRLAGVPKPFQQIEFLGMKPALPIGTIKSQFDLGKFDTETAVSALMSHGFTATAANTIAKDWLDQKIPKGGGGGPKKAAQQQQEIIKLYEQGAVGRLETLAVLEASGMSPEEATKLLDSADTILRAKRRLKRRKVLERRFAYGDILATTLATELMQIGYDQATANEITADAEYDLTYNHRQETATMLCDWFRRGLMDVGEYRTRLHRIGYEQPDVDRIIMTCLTSAPKKSAAAAAPANGAAGGSQTSGAAAGGKPPRRPPRVTLTPRPPRRPPRNGQNANVNSPLGQG